MSPGQDGRRKASLLALLGGEQAVERSQAWSAAGPGRTTQGVSPRSTRRRAGRGAEPGVERVRPGQDEQGETSLPLWEPAVEWGQAWFSFPGAEQATVSSAALRNDLSL